MPFALRSRAAHPLRSFAARCPRFLPFLVSVAAGLAASSPPMASAQTVYLGPSVVVGDVDITPALAEHACLQRL